MPGTSRPGAVADRRAARRDSAPWCCGSGAACARLSARATLFVQPRSAVCTPGVAQAAARLAALAGFYVGQGDRAAARPRFPLNCRFGSVVRLLRSASLAGLLVMVGSMIAQSWCRIRRRATEPPARAELLRPGAPELSARGAVRTGPAWTAFGASPRSRSSTFHARFWFANGYAGVDVSLRAQRLPDHPAAAEHRAVMAIALRRSSCPPVFLVRSGVSVVGAGVPAPGAGQPAPRLVGPAAPLRSPTSELVDLSATWQLLLEHT